MTNPTPPEEQLNSAERALASMNSGFAAFGRGLRSTGRSLRTAGRATQAAGTSAVTKSEPLARRGRDWVQPVYRRIEPVTSVVTGIGWGVLISAVVLWVLGRQLGWVELIVIATACVLIFLVCCLLTIGRTNLHVFVELNPRRVVAGNPASGRVQIHNASRQRLLPVELELPIGASSARFTLPSLPGGGNHEELFVVSTTRRGVINVGPATTVRGDPFGLLRRAVPWTDSIELCVHPLTVPLESLGSGLLRDLEGQTTNDVSMSDLAFHTLREYAPGDDRRYIHWRSSAKVGSVTESGKFLVRQFLDTRRSHLSVIVDGQSSSYDDDMQFETGISAAASVALRAITDEMDTTVLVAQHAAHEASVQLTMDNFARAQAGGERLPVLARRAVQMAPATSVALLVTGPRPDFAELQRAASYFSPEVTVVALRVDPKSNGGISAAGSLTVVTLPQLSSLPALLLGVSMQ